MPDQPSSSRSYLGPGCVFEGEIRGAGSLECHGTLHGAIQCDGEVVIGERGTAEAEIVGGRVVIDGVLEGNARGTDRVEVGYEVVVL